MNERLPFEDAFERQMNDMPAPLENESWQKMKALLEEKKKRRPFVFFKFYQVIGFVLLITLLFTGIVIYYRTTAEKAVTHLNNKSAAPGQTQETTKTLDEGTRANTFNDEDDSKASKKKKDIAVTRNPNDEMRAASNKSKKTTTATTVISGKPSAIKKGNNKLNTVIKAGNTQKPVTVNNRFTNKQANNKVLQTKEEFNVAGNNIKHKNKVIADKENLLPQRTKTAKVNKGLVTAGSEKKKFYARADGIQSDVIRNMETVSNIQAKKELKPDTIAQFQMLTLTNSIKLSDSIAHIAKTAAMKRISSRRGKYFVAAGLGIQQQVPLGGQKAAGYNYNGNKNIATDYIPSIYVRLEKNRHWFLQGEFSYAAPQLVKPISYQQQTTQSFAAGAYTVHSTSVKKTFYNKVPVSLNYYISPRLSIGIGAVYSWLHSAVSEHETLTKDLTTQQQTVATQLVTMKGYKDSFLYRSHTNLLLQANYSINRFSFSLRFAKDLQPYIKYTLPDGTVFKEKNWSLDFALRFRLYQSRNFSLLGKRISKAIKAR